MHGKNERRTKPQCSFVEVFVDYSLVGKAMEFPIDLAKSAAVGLKVGNRFLATGDSVPTYVAEVTELLEDGWAMVRLVTEVTTVTDLTNDSELARTN